ncbi:MAG: GxxExxY protein [Thermoguttaceae bacterium]|jgi:GxxExxY protein
MMGLLKHENLTESIIGAAIEVHKELGPGLMESAHEERLCHELSARNLPFNRQVPLPICYKNIKLDCGYRMDIVVGNTIVLELKSIEKILPIHEAQIITYLKLSKLPVGLLINFNVPLLKDGILRRVN